PTHPSLFAAVVNPMAMQQKEGSHLLFAISFVEFANQVGAQVDQWIGFRSGLVRVRQISDEGKVNIAVVVAEKANLQVFNQATNLLLVQQESRDRHQGYTVVGNS